MRLAPSPGRHVAAETFAQMIERHLQRAVDLDVAAFGFIRCGGVVTPGAAVGDEPRSEEHTSELQSLMRISYAVFCLKKKIYKSLVMNSITHCNHKIVHKLNQPHITT